MSKTKLLQNSVQLPGSKSLSNRAILLAALAKGQSRIRRFLCCEDTDLMLNALSQLGVVFKWDKEDLIVEGRQASLAACDQALAVGNAGTVARFLLPALAAFGSGIYRIESSLVMAKRPLAHLLDAMVPLGLCYHRLGPDFFPLQVQGGSFHGGHMSLQGQQSSQFLSGLLLTAPLLLQDSTIHIEGGLVSRPYVTMTCQMMQAFGVKVQWINANTLFIAGKQSYQSCEYAIEVDASTASYFMALPLIVRGELTISGLQSDSLQGDIAFASILEQMGAQVSWTDEGIHIAYRPLSAVDVDMNAISDVAPTLAVLALFAQGTTHIRNVANMRVKESDRIDVLVKGLRRLGAIVQEYADGLSITGFGSYHPAMLDVAEDHRMAMAFTLAGLAVPGVEINNRACVAKTFPGFFTAIESLFSSSL